jgi:hypothetical protein
VIQHGLSKSRFCSGLQCVRQLWWRVHEPEAPELVSPPDLQEVFDRGHRIGELAQAQFQGGVLIDEEPWAIAQKCAATRAALANEAPAIFEASFVADDAFAAIDILERLQTGFALVEVKSTYSLKPQFIPDVAIQVHIARAAGMDVRRAEVMHVVRDRGRVEGGERFARVDVTARVEAFLPEVPGHLARMREALAGALPVVQPGPWCRVPYECAFLARCQPSSATAAH